MIDGGNMLKTITASILSGFTALGITPDNASQVKAIAIGLLVGLAIRWVQDRNEEERLKLPPRRRLELFVWLAMAGLAAFAADEYLTLHDKILPFVTAVLAFSIRAWVGAIEQKGLKEIAEKVLPFDFKKDRDKP